MIPDRFVDIAGQPALGAAGALGLQRALAAITPFGHILERRSLMGGARRGEKLAARADIDVALRVVLEVVAREETVGASGFIDNRNMWLYTVVHQGFQRPGIAPRLRGGGLQPYPPPTFWG